MELNCMDPRKQIIVALDIDSRAEALRLVGQLQGRVGLFKIGSQLFTAEGPQLVRDIIGMGEQVFLDLKFHDIPNTVVKSASIAQHLGVSMITLHTVGGMKMMSMVMEFLSQTGSAKPLVLGVTVLTSLGNQDLKEVGCDSTTGDQVIRLARLAQQAGLDGVVASPAEIESLRLQVGGAFKIVTPGIRPAGTEKHDQSRFASPGFALRAGADYLVIGRPITASPDPSASVDRILESIQQELAQPRN
jgi:orotidine-5'-phosphate decarboxylase